MAFGRHFIADPDLPECIRLGRALTRTTVRPAWLRDYPLYEQTIA